MLPIMDTGNLMSLASRREYEQRIRHRYRQAGWAEKRRILDEFCANCRYPRKHAIRLLNGPPAAAKPVRKLRRPRGVTYRPGVIRIF
jgi:hypothetical protein